ncbi:unnamed protein product [Blepharisma stoltei]|uniref:Cyclic nucleotide-binding domain-containing protein n=1 Tax=Blepharisma stoltei TaxID=1481888 RepID=A0AAU9JVE6_9CILI|nr:unnamed protein product [Blepharisma stoltei]
MKSCTDADFKRADSLTPQMNPFFSTKQLSRIKTSTPSTRKSDFFKEIKEINKERLIKELTRPKILIQTINIETPKPPSYYIEQARAEYLQKTENFKATNSRSQTDRIKTTASGTRRKEKLSDIPKNEPVQTKQFSQTATARAISPIQKESDIKNFIPEWLMSRTGFQQTYKRMMKGDEIDVGSIVSIYPNHRTEEEKAALFDWIVSTAFFAKIPKLIVKDTCDKLTRLDFEIDKYIIHKGAVADCMYIIYKGVVGIYLHSGEKVGSRGKKEVIGEIGLDTASPRSADVIAEEPTITFVLKKEDYDRMLLNIKKLERYENTKFLMSIEYFKSWSFLKVHRLSSFMIIKTFPAGQVLYDRNDPSNTFYIIKQGQVEVQAYVDLEKQNRWPTSSQEWDLLQINRKYIITLSTIGKGCFFGETDMIDGCPRKTRAVCVTQTICLTINKKQFFEVFSSRDVMRLNEMKSIEMPSKEDLQQRLLKEIKESHESEKALLDALNVDYVAIEGRELFDKKSKRLKHWMTNYKKRKLQTENQMIKKIVRKTKTITSIGNVVAQALGRESTDNSPGFLIEAEIN